MLRVLDLNEVCNFSRWMWNLSTSMILICHLVPQIPLGLDKIASHWIFFRMTMCQSGWHALFSKHALQWCYATCDNPWPKVNCRHVQVEAGRKQSPGSSPDFVGFAWQTIWVIAKLFVVNKPGHGWARRPWIRPSWCGGGGPRDLFFGFVLPRCQLALQSRECVTWLNNTKMCSKSYENLQ